nr:immunoglobulin light chain junction region [Macaca mulatta]
CMQYTHKYSF